LFLTCWLIFAVHFTPTIVREHFLAIGLAEEGSFRVDRYHGLHVDLFDRPGYGVHINSNPGASMLAAIPYWVCRPIISGIVDRVNANRAAAGEPVTTIYHEPDERKVEFFRQVRTRGLDVKLGLAAGVTQALFMAPLSAAAAVLMLRMLMVLGAPERRALLFALLYALGTPIFFRTAYLNHNLLLAHLTLLGFSALWLGEPASRRRPHVAIGIAGLAGGLALLTDYAGGIVLAWLGTYGGTIAFQRGGWPAAVRAVRTFAAAAAVPVLMLLFYQWRSFGSPWFPAQHYLRPLTSASEGYRTAGLPQWDLFVPLLFDPRFGLFVTCPFLVLAVGGFLMAVRRGTIVPRREVIFLAGLSAAFVGFFSGLQYTRIEWIAGLRYLTPIVPCLFLLSVPILLRLRGAVLYVIAVAALFQAWCLSMVRSTYVLDSITGVFTNGLQLPWLTVLARTESQYLPFMTGTRVALPLFMIVAAVIAVIWWWPPASRAAQRPADLA
jgi:hypothetical protein